MPEAMYLGLALAGVFVCTAVTLLSDFHVVSPSYEGAQPIESMIEIHGLASMGRAWVSR